MQAQAWRQPEDFEAEPLVLLKAQVEPSLYHGLIPQLGRLCKKVARLRPVAVWAQALFPNWVSQLPIP